jgi:RNA polymerase sigma-70 factor (ECF subfamily)
MEGSVIRGSDDTALVKKANRGSERAFRTLIERHSGVVHAVVRGILGDRHDAEDVVQEVFIRIYRGLPSYRGDAKLSTWIYRIARNHALNVLGRTDRANVPIEEARHVASTEPRPDAALGRAELQMEVERLLADLDEPYRIALELRYMAERSYAEIAGIMDVPVGTVKTYIHRGKLMLKRMLDGAGGRVPGERPKVL